MNIVDLLDTNIPRLQTEICNKHYLPLSHTEIVTNTPYWHCRCKFYSIYLGEYKTISYLFKDNV